MKLKSILEQQVLPDLERKSGESLILNIPPKDLRKKIVNEEWLKRLDVDGEHYELMADDKVLFDVFCVQRKIGE